MTQTPVVVVGGGAAGMMAALAARRAGAAVVLLEPNEKLGRKLYITGKGRCNLTNNTTPEGVLAHVTRNGRFLYSAVTRFPPAAVMEYFEALGVPLKTERGGRVFPCSDRAADVIDALFFALKKGGRGPAPGARRRNCGWPRGGWLACPWGRRAFPPGAVILATGGLSYPRHRLHGGRVPAGPVGRAYHRPPPRPLWFHWRRRGTPARRCRDFP